MPRSDQEIFGAFTAAVDTLFFAAPMGGHRLRGRQRFAGRDHDDAHVSGPRQTTSGVFRRRSPPPVTWENPRRPVGPVLDSPAHTPASPAAPTACPRPPPPGSRITASTRSSDGQSDVCRGTMRSGAIPSACASLSIATAMPFGDPRVILSDRPPRVLDPPGIIWLRATSCATSPTRAGASSSPSHNLGELRGHRGPGGRPSIGRLVADATLADLLTRGASAVMVSTPKPSVSPRPLRLRGGSVEEVGPEDLRISPRLPRHRRDRHGGTHRAAGAHGRAPGPRVVLSASDQCETPRGQS